MTATAQVLEFDPPTGPSDTLGRLIFEAAEGHPGVSSDSLAGAILNDLAKQVQKGTLTTAALTDLLKPAVTAYISTRRRSWVRGGEEKVFADGKPIVPDAPHELLPPTVELAPVVDLPKGGGTKTTPPGGPVTTRWTEPKKGGKPRIQSERKPVDLTDKKSGKPIEEQKREQFTRIELNALRKDPALRDRLRMMDSMVTIAKGEKPIAWMDLTLDQHQLRINDLRDLRKGVSDTIANHEKAVAEIKAAGVKNLREVWRKKGWLITS